jgi:hypothetical protein
MSNIIEIAKRHGLIWKQHSRSQITMAVSGGNIHSQSVDYQI